MSSGFTTKRHDHVIIQAGLSLVVICFAMVMIATGHETSIYLPIITIFVGVWLPQPSQPKVAPYLASDQFSDSLLRSRSPQLTPPSVHPSARKSTYSSNLSPAIGPGIFLEPRRYNSNRLAPHLKKRKRLPEKNPHDSVHQRLRRIMIKDVEEESEQNYNELINFDDNKKTDSKDKQLPRVSSTTSSLDDNLFSYENLPQTALDYDSDRKKFEKIHEDLRMWHRKNFKQTVNI